jgi:hypothetical protein
MVTNRLLNKKPITLIFEQKKIFNSLRLINFPRKLKRITIVLCIKYCRKTLVSNCFFLQIVKTGLEITETKVEINKLKKFEVPVITDEAFV